MTAPLSRRRGARSAMRVGSGDWRRLICLIATAVPFLIFTMLRTFRSNGDYGTYETLSALDLLPDRQLQEVNTAATTASAGAADVSAPMDVRRQRQPLQKSDEGVMNRFGSGGEKTIPSPRSDSHNIKSLQAHSFTSTRRKNVPPQSTRKNRNDNQSMQKLPAADASIRRTKAHFCYSRVHGEMGTNILKSEFGFESVDAGKGDDWDLIYGGYPHCAKTPRAYEGNRHRWDWDMKYGLNRILNERGWDNLKPNQVYHPCMGCANSYCNKRELCRILRDINPELCYVLPDDLERLKGAMDGSRIWVMKKDASNIHIHTGQGVSYMKHPRELPTSKELSKGIYLVQPWNEPYLGEGMYRRKSELRIYVALTSVYPLRAYAYKDMYVVIAGKEYTHAAEAMSDKCMHDTHSATKDCNRFVSSELQKELNRISIGNRLLRFEDYVERVGMTETQQEQLVGGALDMIHSVLKAGHPVLQDHHINNGIHSSGATCFSWMRVDIGISTDAKPFIFEFPEFHMNYGENELIAATNRDLFRMVGLDQAPVLQDERAAFEAAHLGGWMPLPVSSYTAAA